MGFTAVVVPTIRKECIIRFLKEWSAEFTKAHVHLYIVEDNPEVSFDVGQRSFVYKHFSWADIDTILGRDLWIIPRKTDCVRSFGYWQAYKDGASNIITLDDDCYPPKFDQYPIIKEYQPKGVITKHLQNLRMHTCQDAWQFTIAGLRPRGIPYENIDKIYDVVISHGLWLNVPDLDALTQITCGKPFKYDFIRQIIPFGKYYPMCGMNVAFSRQVVPSMYFLLMGRDYPYDRFGDIWAGIFTKKIADHLGHRVSSGTPLIWHERASNPWSNLDKERAGYPVNEELWKVVDANVLQGSNYSECYKELAQQLSKVLSGSYWKHATNAMLCWAELFE